MAVIDGIPVTTAARTLLDLAAVSPADAVEEALDEALRRGLVTLSRLRWRMDELGRRPGSGTMRRLIDARRDGGRAVKSVLETRVLRLLKRTRLPRPERQHPVRDRGHVVAIVDFAYPEFKLAIEADSYQWHSGRGAWRRDLHRRNRLTHLGWYVLHVTSDDVDHRADELIAAIAAILKPGRRPR